MKPKLSKRHKSSQARRREADIEPTIIQIIAADPRWHALYEGDDGPYTTPLVCFALLEGRVGRGRPFRFVRPMVAREYGLVEDVNDREGFVCLVPPCMHHGAHSERDVNDAAVDDDHPDRETTLA